MTANAALRRDETLLATSAVDTSDGHLDALIVAVQLESLRSAIQPTPAIA